MKSQHEVSQLMIATNFAHADGDTFSDLENNELGLVSMGGGEDVNTLYTDESGDTFGNGSIFKAAVKRANGLHEFSDAIKAEDIKSISIYTYDSGVQEQVDYIGYDAENDSDAIDVANESQYHVSVLLYGENMADFARQEKLQIPYFSGASATQFGIASGIVSLAYQNMMYARVGYIPYRFEVVSSIATGSATDITDTSTGDITFTKDSKYAVAATDADGEMSVGDYIRAGTGVKAPVYKIVSFPDATTIELDRPYRGATETFDAKDTSSDIEYIEAATANAGDFGVKIIGQTPTGVPGYFDSYVTSFKTSIATPSETTISRMAVKPVEDAGRTAAVAQLEAELMGARGVEYRTAPRYEFQRSTYASATNGYDIVHINYVKTTKDSMGDDIHIPAELILAVDETNDVSGNIKDAIGAGTGGDLEDKLQS